MKTWLKIVLICLGLFVGYNVGVVLYALTKHGIMRVLTVARYAPWLLYF